MTEPAVAPAAAPGLSARAVVRALYRCLLLREPDPEGLAGYERFLAEGGGVEEAIQNLMRSAEFQPARPTSCASTPRLYGA